MSDEPTAIRHPKRGKAHRLVPREWNPAGYWTEVACDTFAGYMTERVPLSQTAPEDRCSTCWTTTKDVTP